MSKCPNLAFMSAIGLRAELYIANERQLVGLSFPLPRTTEFARFVAISREKKGQNIFNTLEMARVDSEHISKRNGSSMRDSRKGHWFKIQFKFILLHTGSFPRANRIQRVSRKCFHLTSR